MLGRSQSKARGLSMSEAGLANTTAGNAEVVGVLLGLRAQRDALVGTYPHLARATVVYEFFSNRAAPADEDLQVEMRSKGFELQPNERAIVVRGGKFAEALGPVFADLRQAESEVKRRRLG